jgi:TRAP-type C4-dicarboxylate transport system permease small subunit|tara:strand:- start:2132 stop:2680 length:549 start_codon:yes stop_codon:yes gene_type:complete
MKVLSYLNIPIIREIDIWSARISRALMVIAAMWAFLLAFYILIDVVGRAFGYPLKGTHELVKNAIVMIAFMQTAYCVMARSMLRADFILHLLGGKTETFINSAGYILGALFFAGLFLGTIEPAWHAIVSGEFEGEGALRVPTWPARVVVLFSAGLLVINYMILALKEILPSYVIEAESDIAG